MTEFNDFDITFPSIGPDAIVFQAGGRLYLLDLPAEKVNGSADPRRHGRDDAAGANGKGRSSLIRAASVSPTGKRARVRSARRRVYGAGGVRRGAST